jgi:hypothetical protein
MAKIDYYATAKERDLQHGHIPDLSHDLESIRRFQWELVFNCPTGEGPIPNGLTLAAKQVSPIGHAMERITSERVNDKFYYAGKVNTEPITVTFDNLVLGDTASVLYEWFASIYDPRTGILTDNFKQGIGNFKVNCQLFQLSNERKPIKHTHLYAVFPNSWKEGEFNYATNEFHTIEMTFSYDFAVQESNPNG